MYNYTQTQTQAQAQAQNIKYERGNKNEKI